MGWKEILNMKKVYALPKNLGFIVSFDNQGAIGGAGAPGASLVNVLDHMPIQGE
jgi:hypothetical protein